MKKGLAVLALSLIFATSLFADVPKTINYQGRLRDATNLPVADGQYMITFRLYDADTGGTKVWEESQLLNVKQGYFNTTLGNINALSSTMFNQTLWLGLKVGNEAEMTPRQALSSTPQSFNVADGIITAAKISSNAVTTDKIADGAVTSTKLATTALGITNPIGSIIAWHKSMSGTPTLPEQWVECNGQTLNDSASPYNGQVIPNLNGASSGANSPGFSSKEQLFLRGGGTSGVGQSDEFKQHNHSFAVDGGAGDNYAEPNTIINRSITWNVYVVGNSGGSETRPKNVSMVWIMRIK